MKRLLTILLFTLALATPVVAGAGNVQAADVFGNTCGSGGVAQNTDVCQTVNSQGSNGQNPIIKIISAAITVIAIVIGFAAIIGIIVSAIRIMTAGGDPSAVASARSGLVTCLAGVVVAALAEAIVAFVLSKVQ